MKNAELKELKKKLSINCSNDGTHQLSSKEMDQIYRALCELVFTRHCLEFIPYCVLSEHFTDGEIERLMGHS